MNEIILTAIPSAVTAFCFWLVEHQIQKTEIKREKEENERRKAAEEQKRQLEQFQIALLDSVNASIALGEATARAVERIPDAKCNGDMHAALQYATAVKHKQRNFLTAQGIAALFERKED